jgi:hypothetical protein
MQEDDKLPILLVALKVQQQFTRRQKPSFASFAILRSGVVSKDLAIAEIQVECIATKRVVLDKTGDRRTNSIHPSIAILLQNRSREAVRCNTETSILEKLSRVEADHNTK